MSPTADPQSTGIPLVPCPHCTDGFPTSGDRHARTKMDVCGTCGGTHLVPAHGQDATTGKRGKVAPVVTVDFGRRDQDGAASLSLSADGAVFATGIFPGTLPQALAFAGQVNAIPTACAVMRAVLDVCRSDENDVALPSSLVDQIQDALAAMGIRA